MRRMKLFGVIRKRHNTMKNVPDVGNKSAKRRSPFLLYFKTGPNFTAETQIAKQRMITAIGRVCGPLVASLVPESGGHGVTMNGVKTRKAFKVCTTTLMEYARAELGAKGEKNRYIYSPEEIRSVFERHRADIEAAVREAIGA